jgi:SAM-dependent methyltransferase
MNNMKSSKYQRIELDSGQLIEGHDRAYLLEHIFRDGIAGKSLLDIGSASGYFCIEALRNGASRALGLEVSPSTIAGAREIAERLNLPAEYVEADFEEWSGEERFDVIVCLNVLHHMFDPIHSLRRMMKMAREKIVLEIANATFEDARKWRVNPFAWIGSAFPLIAPGTPRRTSEITDRTFMFTPSAVRLLFNWHTHVFEPVLISESPLKNRFIVEARRRRIRNLTIVAGPTSSGKSTFRDYLAKDENLRAKFGLPAEPARMTSANNVKDLPPGAHDHVLLHYDVLRPYKRSLRTHDRDPATSILECAEKVSIFTIMATPDRMRQQLRSGEIVTKAFWRRPRRHLDLLEQYAQPNFLHEWYAAWFKFCDRHKARVVKNVVVENDGDYRFHPAESWRAIYAGIVANVRKNK